ncbi:MAG: hypothetical protein M1600_01000 [Firmicutes bacterium]|nr:hypothetical protein [Bacillota bacterium]
MEIIDNGYPICAAFIASPVPIDGWHEAFFQASTRNPVLDRVAHPAWNIER